MDIFKLIFEHDITLEQLSGNDTNTDNNHKTILASFLKPQQTYNRYFFSGTRIREEQFGLTTLAAYPEILKTLDNVFLHSEMSDRDTSNRNSDASPASGWHLTDRTHFNNLAGAIRQMNTREVLISGRSSDESVRRQLARDGQNGIRECSRPLAALLDCDHTVIVSEKARDGMDIHLFSRHNLYELLFNAFRLMVNPEFRYFSINGKRIASERHFYFETWTLERPPHGFQEVTSNARIR